VSLDSEDDWQWLDVDVRATTATACEVCHKLNLWTLFSNMKILGGKAGNVDSGCVLGALMVGCAVDGGGSSSGSGSGTSRHQKSSSGLVFYFLGENYWKLLTIEMFSRFHY
jgi:hypothetical protein